MLFSLGVTPKTEMRPAGKSGPSLILSCLDTTQFEPGGLHPGGRVADTTQFQPGFTLVDYARQFEPSLRLAGTQSEATLETSVGSPQHLSPAEQAGRRSVPPIHNALTSTVLGGALDWEKSDPKAIVRRLHVNWGHASAQQL